MAANPTAGEPWAPICTDFFDTPDIIRQWLDTIGLNHLTVASLQGPAARQKAYDALADHMETYLDMEAIRALMER